MSMEERKTYDEILEFALLKERQAYRFFLAMAERVGDPTIRKIFEELAAEELEHKAKIELELMKAGRVVDTSTEEGPIDSSEYVLYTNWSVYMDEPNNTGGHGTDADCAMMGMDGGAWYDQNCNWGGAFICEYDY